MREKNFGRKVLSPSSDDDINEETIVDNDVDNTIDDTIVKPKKRSKKKKVTKKICKSCNRDIIKNENRDMLRYTNTHHQLMTKNYCKEHTTSHTDHTCKPSWCGDCGFLMNYEIVLKFDK